MSIKTNLLPLLEETVFFVVFGSNLDEMEKVVYRQSFGSGVKNAFVC